MIRGDCGVRSAECGIGSDKKPFSISYTLVFLLLAMGACSPFLSEEPPVSDSTMVEVLIELHLARARHDIQQDLPPTLHAEILEAYGLTEQAFRETMAFYTDHPETYMAVYTRVMDRLAAERNPVGSPEDGEMEILTDTLTN
jgi:hypothetical protein